jgi:hypothetical protein
MTTTIYIVLCSIRLNKNEDGYLVPDKREKTTSDLLTDISDELWRWQANIVTTIFILFGKKNSFLKRDLASNYS